MYLVLIAWFYVALMMAVAEATSNVGSLLGAVMTFSLYGLLPMSVVGYIMSTPARKRRRLAQEAAQLEAQQQALQASAADPNASRESPRDAIAPVREKA
ncbi:hypothetical protein [Limnohabitans sp.]|uniref:hypothetical protein n=1 Tax=Limnohabitans sp. TaxID=1907725 RepID=UPI0038BC5482